MEVFIQFDGGRHQLLEGNCKAVRFRKPYKEFDYLEYREPHEDTERYHWLFNLTEFVLWASGVVLDREDDKTLRLANRNNGDFAEQSGGWYVDTEVFNQPTEAERELWVEFEASSLDREWDFFDEQS